MNSYWVYRYSDWEIGCKIRHLNPNRNERFFCTLNLSAPLWCPLLLHCLPGCCAARNMAGVWCWSLTST